MNEIRRIGSEADEIARIRVVMDRFSMPNFVLGYTVTLGEFDEEPALWIRFKTTHRYPDSPEQRLAVGKELSSLSLTAYDYLGEHYPERRAYFRFGSDDHEQSREV